MQDKIYTFAILLGILFLARQVYNYISVARFKRKHGCKPEKQLPQLERIIGIGYFPMQKEASKNRRLLALAKERYDTYGLTWSLKLMGTRFCEIIPSPYIVDVNLRGFPDNTIEVENVKAVLATNFKDFGLGQRQASFDPLLGKGIFTTGLHHSPPLGLLY
jgi:hypothetical protein